MNTKPSTTTPTSGVIEPLPISPIGARDHHQHDHQHAEPEAVGGKAEKRQRLQHRDARERRDLGQRDEAGKGALVRRIVHRRADFGGAGMHVFGHEIPETVGEDGDRSLNTGAKNGATCRRAAFPGIFSRPGSRKSRSARNVSSGRSSAR